MAVYKCKMCGGTLEVQFGESVAVCDSCGSKQTVPTGVDERISNLFGRANHLRLANEFDKALSIYEQILNEDDTNAEAHWGALLCRYGIEYVEDPMTHKRVPTMNRAQYTSVLADEDHKAAIAYADGYQKEIYEREAKEIDKIQKGILTISQKEEPFDVFISFKETGADGQRTLDAVLANDLYHQLTQEGFKVFFAPITLEDKLGSEYEPYIFAALNSAKVMVALGTKPEYFTAPWVKNEWSRFLALIKNGAKKTLVPAYKDMNPYDLPEEFSHLMAQDMSKLGFMQDLIRGIKKLSAKEEVMSQKSTADKSEGTNNTALLERGYMALEDREWGKADSFFEQVLNSDAKNVEAYFGKLMADIRVSSKEDLRNCTQPFDNNSNYQKVLRFASQEIKDELRETVVFIKNRNEEARINSIYSNAVEKMKVSETEDAFKNTAEIFNSILDYKDSNELKKECLEKAEICRKDDNYDKASSRMTGENIVPYEEAISIFQTISGWKDSDEKAYACKKKIEELNAKEEAERLEAEHKAEEKRSAEEKAARKLKKSIAIAALAIIACIAVVLVTKVIVPNFNYNAAVSLMNEEKYEEAISAFEAMNGYKDSAEQITACRIAMKDLEKDIEYDNAVLLKNEGKYLEAIEVFSNLEGYKDSREQIKTICLEPEYLRTLTIGNQWFFGSYEQDNDRSNDKEVIEWHILEKEDSRMLVISKYALDEKRYNEKEQSVTWENCSLRKWLNSDFINDAFSTQEQSMIQNTAVPTDWNTAGGANHGNATTDKVFLLSMVEAEKYFTTDGDRQCTSVKLIKDAKENKDTSLQNIHWWLRSPGHYSSYAVFINIVGWICNIGEPVSECHGVRPAMWINLNS